MTDHSLARRTLLTGALGGAAALGATAGLPRPARAQPTAALRYGMSMSDVPLTTGQPDRGAGAYQFTGLTLYDPLVAWEMNIADRPGKLIPGLATSWETDAADRRNWTFRLRDNVKFHDGSVLDADAVVWNLEKVLNPQAAHFDNRQAAQVKPRLPSVASYRKLDPMTVQITTKAVDALFPYQLLWFLVSSPAQYAKLGNSWEKFAFQPSGTRAVPHGAVHAAGPGGAAAQSRLLGPHADGEAREADAGVLAGRSLAHQRPAVGPGSI